MPNLIPSLVEGLDTRWVSKPDEPRQMVIVLTRRTPSGRRFLSTYITSDKCVLETVLYYTDGDSIDLETQEPLAEIARAINRAGLKGTHWRVRD